MHLSVICTGNICRSPIGEVVYADALADLPDFRVTSAGTAVWHVGQAMDPRARAALDRAGFTRQGSLGAYADRTYLDSVDVVIAMTRDHRRDVLAVRPDAEVVLVREMVGDGELDVADPYFGSDADFDDVLRVIRLSVPGLRRHLARRGNAASRPEA